MWETTKQDRKGNRIPYLCERISDPMTGKQKVLIVRIATNNAGKITAAARKDALRELQLKLEKAQAGQAPEKMKLSALIEKYNAEQEKTVRPSTRKRNASSLQTMLDIVGDVYVQKMTAGYIRGKLIESGKENSTLNELIKRFKTFLNWAYKNDYIGREVSDKLDLFPDRSAREKVEDKYLERDELQKLLNAMDIERWRLLSSFLALSGLRVGEAIALNSEDVDGQYIHVSKTYNEALALLGDAKTSTSVRDVYIQPELAEVIRKIRICMAKQKLMYGYEDKGYFMAGIDGGRVGYAAYNKYLHQIAKQVLPDKKITPHIFRHTMTSLFAEQGVPMEIIAARLGHGENSGTTRRVYFHLTQGAIDANKEYIDAVHF